MPGYSNAGIFGVGVTHMTLIAGASAGLFFQSPPGTVWTQIALISGSSLEIQPAPNGTTQPGGSLAAGVGHFIVGQGQNALNLDGPARFYLVASGATAVVSILSGLSAPGYNYV